MQISFGDVIIAIAFGIAAWFVLLFIQEEKWLRDTVRRDIQNRGKKYVIRDLRYAVLESEQLLNDEPSNLRLRGQYNYYKHVLRVAERTIIVIND